jgi:hypothetical protein
MKQTRQEYIKDQQQELEKEGLKPYEILGITFDNEYYELIENHIKQGETITNEVYNSLTQGQQYHFNKHYNYRNDKVINSDYEQEIRKAKKQAEINYNKYLQEQAEKQQEQEIQEQKEKERNIKKLAQEIEQLQNNLFDYNNLSSIGKRNIKKLEHEKRQNTILQKIAKLREQIKAI